MLMGAPQPGSGKSTWANEIKNFYNDKAEIISSDAIRAELFGDESIQGDPNKVFEIAHDRIVKSVENKEVKITIFDATNIKRKHRQVVMDKLKDYNVLKKCLIFAEPYEVLIKRNAQRARTVPNEVIWKMLTNFEVPLYTEGYDSITVVNNNFVSMGEYIKNMREFTQDNPHHSLDLYTHCLRASEHIKEMQNLNIFEREILEYSALLHDIGKLFTKSFTDIKGNESQIAHYYGHDRLSGYLSLVYDIKELSREERLLVAQLICYHMQPYFNRSEKAQKKWENIWGEDFTKLILLLHEADVIAH